MKVTLRATKANPANGELEELEKDFDLPFAPYVGLKVLLSEDCKSERHNRLYKRSLEKHGPVVSPLFLLYDALYIVESEKFLVKAGLHLRGNAGDQALHDAGVEQMVFGYGFTTWASRMEAMEIILDQF